MYHVWRRHPDGYVAATTHMPDSWKPANGPEITFEKLGQYSLWQDAFDRILEERGPDQREVYVPKHYSGPRTEEIESAEDSDIGRLEAV